MGVYPNKPDFAMMPPHFINEGNLMDDPDIYEVMHLMYGPILDEYNEAIDPTGLLLFVLSSLIYHSPWLVKIVTRKPGHPFALIPLLNKSELLKRM